MIRKCALALTMTVALSSCHREADTGNTTRGKQLIEQYGCTSCHIIPGVAGPRGRVGPSLNHVGSKAQIGEKLPNTPATMAEWLQHPQGNMPNLNIPPADSRDIAAFLATLK